MTYAHEAPVVALEGDIVTDSVFTLTEHALTAAQDIAGSSEFDAGRAALLIHTLPVLSGGMDGEAVALLSRSTQGMLFDIAVDSYQLAGSEAMADATQALELKNPHSVGDAVAIMLSNAFQGLWRTVSIGPDHIGGYQAYDEPAIRAMVTTYAHAFSMVYRELDAAGHPLAADRGLQDYFSSSITAALPASLRPQRPSAAEWM